MNLKGTSTEPPKRPTAIADAMPAARSPVEVFDSWPSLSEEGFKLLVISSFTSVENLCAMASQFTMIRAPATSRARAAPQSWASTTGAATSAGPKAPQPKATRMAEQDQTAWAVASPARGIATKLNRAANTKRDPPRKPPRVNTKGVPKSTGTSSDERKTPQHTSPLKSTGSSAGPLGIRAQTGKEPLKKEDSAARAKAAPACSPPASAFIPGSLILCVACARPECELRKG
mmetsp:Transcript_75859/g.136868  ORF Transcript_75859/g.136868 Transcript_75859/m.136868 type:complete len:231 (-) Transcript_75859:216-908(-)